MLATRDVTAVGGYDGQPDFGTALNDTLLGDSWSALAPDTAQLTGAIATRPTWLLLRDLGESAVGS
jgi:hypothetical protein